MAEVVLEKVYKQFPSRNSGAPLGEESELSVLRDINLTLGDGEFLVLVGPSGCGKSTLLRLLAGLETLSAGNIYIDGRLVNALPPKARDIAMVFQSYALYPHLTVLDNIAFGLRRRGHPLAPGEILRGLTGFLPPSFRYRSPQERKLEQRVREVAERLQIDRLLDRYPKQLSGGQKQRVALGRAIARNPQVFLMDEPLSNLDAQLRAETRAQIVQLQRQLGVTTLYVTHDQTEAMTMGDRIAVLNQGTLQQLASPLELYQNPANRFVAEFIGSPPMNFLTMKVQTPDKLAHPGLTVTLPPHWGPRLSLYQGGEVWFGIRPERFRLAAEGEAGSFRTLVNLVEQLGNETIVLFSPEPAPNLTLQARFPPQPDLKPNQKLTLALDVRHIHLFDPQTGASLGYET
ncbi:MAG: ABC transporter ATP-binding protein [Cyanobacteriota bacterium]|nr:ABC transporter ATP-binding protein [Cyanobacteriota bacterium]